ncbi:hypothetical protein [Stigmatella hybrida]|nr:hypothetical protein [Stigmatella hybrida]
MSPRLPPPPAEFPYRGRSCIAWSAMPLRPPPLRRRIHAHGLLKF